MKIHAVGVSRMDDTLRRNDSKGGDAEASARFKATNKNTRVKEKIYYYFTLSSMHDWFLQILVASPSFHNAMTALRSCVLAEFRKESVFLKLLRVAIVQCSSAG